MITKEDLAKAILELKESQAETDKQIKETSMQIKETSMQMKETQKTLKKVTKLVGNISNNQGDITEEFFYNSLENNPTLVGINYDFIDNNIHRSKNKIEDEYDIFLVNGKDIGSFESQVA